MCLPFYRAGRVSEYIINFFSHLLSKMGHMVSRVNRGERSTAGTEFDPCQLCWRVGAPVKEFSLLLFDNSILYSVCAGLFSGRTLQVGGALLKWTMTE